MFTSLQFVPDEFANTGGMLDSIYPGLSTSDLTCLTPFGVGWEFAAERRHAWSSAPAVTAR